MTSRWRVTWRGIPGRLFPGVVMATSEYWVVSRHWGCRVSRRISSRRTHAVRRARGTEPCHVTCTCYAPARQSLSVAASSLPGVEPKPSLSVSSKQFHRRTPSLGPRTDNPSASTPCQGIALLEPQSSQGCSLSVSLVLNQTSVYTARPQIRRLMHRALLLVLIGSIHGGMARLSWPEWLSGRFNCPHIITHVDRLVTESGVD